MIVFAQKSSTEQDIRVINATTSRVLRRRVLTTGRYYLYAVLRTSKSMGRGVFRVVTSFVVGDAFR